jgi:hypothetical protein
MKRPNEPVSLLPTAVPTEDDVVFFAGFYEGEGSAQGGARNGTTVHVVQKDQELLHRGRSLWGGSICLNNRGISDWVMSGDRARKFLIAIYPYLSARRKGQIEAAGGLTLTGRASMEFGGMPIERLQSRESMTVLEKRREVARISATKHRAKHKAGVRAWQQANREHLNELQRNRRRRLRAQASPENFERSPLIQ